MKKILIMISLLILNLALIGIVSANNMTIEGDLSFTIYLNITEKTHKATAEFVELGCMPNWECTGWGEYEGIMIRNCQDTNNCAYYYPKPIEKIWSEEDISISAEGIKEQQKQRNILPAVSLIFFLITLTLLAELLILRRKR